MAYLVLARKYRPQTFEQVVRQQHVTQTLSHAISTDRVAHALLFSGPRGTGKTTIARILAKAMNCKEGPTPTPCNACRSCREITTGHAADVFEIDGASNNGVDQVRELRENIKYMPSHSRFKIYIIDEVHMLSLAAFNALLKTLEEPPPHVLFMFATTEAHKIPITILSRCQRHDLRRIDLQDLIAHLQSLCQSEEVTVAPETLALIAREAGGSMRDALSLLDQILAGTTGAINHEQVLDLLGVVDRQVLHELTQALVTADVPALLTALDDITDRGHDLKKLYADLLQHLRDLIIVKMGAKVDQLVDLPSQEIKQMAEVTAQLPHSFLVQLFDKLSREETAVRFAAQPKLALEMAFIRLAGQKPVLAIDELIAKLDALQGSVDHACPPVESVQPPPQPPTGPDQTPTMINPAPSAASTTSSPQPAAAPVDQPTNSTPHPPKNKEQAWHTLKKAAVAKHPSLSRVFANGKVVALDANQVSIEIRGSDFDIKMAQRPKTVESLRAICADLFGDDYTVEIKARVETNGPVQSEKEEKQQLKQQALNHPTVAEAIDIFNGKVVDVKIL